jgi:hypothetical protein
VIFEPGKKHLIFDISFTNYDILAPSLYQCVETTGNPLIVVSAIFAPPFTLHCHQRNVYLPVMKRFTRHTLHTVNRKHFSANILCIEPFCPQKVHNRTLLSDTTCLKHGRHFDYWNEPLNMHMRVSYLDCHEAGLCCYLGIRIVNLLRPSQLFYFHLWHIYWLSVIHTALWFDCL